MVRLRSGKGRQHHRTGGTPLRNGECSVYPETHRGTDTACPSRVFLFSLPSFSFRRQSATEPSFQKLDIVQLSSPALLSYLQERGINTALAKRECREAHFTNNGKRYFAIAFPNISGGYEIRNRYFKGCIAPKEISHIRQSGEPRKACYVFEGFMDYLSFLTLRLESCPQFPDFDRQDYMVLNSVANVSKALYPLGSYERIHCFLDNDRAGMEALQQIRKESMTIPDIYVTLHTFTADARI